MPYPVFRDPGSMPMVLSFSNVCHAAVRFLFTTKDTKITKREVFVCFVLFVVSEQHA
jgi:hypothetical protein